VAHWGLFKTAKWREKEPTTLSSSIYCTFLADRGKVVGVMAMKMRSSDESLAPEGQRLLEPFPARRLWQLSGLIWPKRQNRPSFCKQPRDWKDLYSIRYPMISEPLSSITGALSSLRDEGYSLSGSRVVSSSTWPGKRRKNEPLYQ